MSIIEPEGDNDSGECIGKLYEINKDNKIITVIKIQKQKRGKYENRIYWFRKCRW